MTRNTGGMGNPPTADENDVLSVAADWHTRLDGDDVPMSVRAEFDAWLIADTRHRDAFRSIERVWTQMGEGRADPRILDLRRDALNTARGARRSIRVMTVAAIVVIVCGLISVGASQLTGHGFAASDLGASNRIEGGVFRTAIGERSTMTMSDGSTIMLNTNTRVDVRFSPRERLVRLVGGQAWFQVARNPGRPFVVEAGEQRVTALGTEFDVRLADRDAVQVTLTEGRVTIAPIQSTLAALLSAAPAATQLEPGESITATGDQPVVKRKADVSRVGSWRQGQIVFDDDTLDTAAAEVNRYSHTQIVLADPALASLRVSGVFTVGHSESFVETVVGHYPIRVTEHTDERIVLVGIFQGKH